MLAAMRDFLPAHQGGKPLMLYRMTTENPLRSLSDTGTSIRATRACAVGASATHHRDEDHSCVLAECVAKLHGSVNQNLAPALTRLAIVRLRPVLRGSWAFIHEAV